ncbi:MAG: DUF3365 domain-containing protein [Nitrospirota bacterium]|nr:DUF3365 domain-containing protein [Nitrospirota bacterium]MDE3117767.1 DUF3365 domain-containing protein [Nitrospirota bacterium]MDE3225987.1 DUF3365 domain-containing protein [Nitrospirota bacterium]MDE3241676.1 DUF3365 domain-containing protein [Nitrospirota bacterium]
MKPPVIWGMVLVLLLLVGIGGYWGLSALLKDSETQVTIAPEVVADYVHAVIQANRTVYTTNVVDKMQESGIVAAAEHWKGENALPLPAQFLMETGRLVAESGKGIKYKLVSLWPIYVWNKPETEFERKGLEAVAKSPERPFTGFVRIGRERYFQAIYADVAVSQACVTCHNQHINSSRRDFKLHDVMGGIVITIPVAP